MSELIQWAGRTLSGVDRFGRWVNTDLDGWWDSPETKGETVNVPNGDGELDLPIYNDPRNVTLTGGLHTAGHQQTHDAMTFLTGAMKGRFQVSGHGPTQWADAKRDGKIKFTPITDTYAQWQVPLKMVDPVKYGDTAPFTVPSGASYVNLYHRGNYIALPTIVVAGSMAGGYELQSSAGAVYRVTRALVAGSPHTIDMRDGMLQVGGGYSAGGVARADLWRVPPGSAATTIRIQPIIGGTATATVYVTDSYI